MDASANVPGRSRPAGAIPPLRAIQPRPRAARCRIPGDIRALINQFGEKGACLWDPYLSAADILRTLFYCPHNGANLRALTAGREYASDSIPKPTLASLRRQLGEWLRQSLWTLPPQPTFAEKQRAVFQAANS